MDTHLDCLDPAANRLRAYHVTIQADLFAECALVASWGRIGQRGRTRVVGSGDAATERAMAERFLRTGERHGQMVAQKGCSPGVTVEVNGGLTRAL